MQYLGKNKKKDRDIGRNACAQSKRVCEGVQVLEERNLW